MNNGQNENKEISVMEETQNENLSVSSNENGKKRDRTRSILADVVENFEVIIFAVVAVVLIFAVGVRICFVSGDSMNRTLQDKDWVIVSSIGYEPERGDIIVFHMTSERYPRLNEPMVKRVIAVGGEWIDIDFDTWTVRIADNPEMNNAITVEEPYRYLAGSYTLKSSYSYPLEIPEGYIFVMGDNRNGSLDSRNADQIGLVDTRRVLGKVLFRAYPFKPIEN